MISWRTEGFPWTVVRTKSVKKIIIVIGSFANSLLSSDGGLDSYSRAVGPPGCASGRE